MKDEKVWEDFREYVLHKHNTIYGVMGMEVQNAIISYLAYKDFNDYRDKAIKKGLWPSDIDRGIKFKETGFVYFIGDGECVKIGFSTNPKNRLSNLQVGSSKELKLLYTIQGSEKDERAIQNLFSDYYERGEWYKIEGRLKGFLDMDETVGD